MRAKNWEVGSTWYSLPPSRKSENLKVAIPALPDGYGLSFLSTCRSAIGLILDQQNCMEKIAMLPSFTCHSVIEPFANRGFDIDCYPINRDLTIDWDGFISKVNKVNPAVILIHSYFGFNNSSGGDDIIKDLKIRGIKIIEDMTQSMLSCCHHLLYDYAVGSMRKWVSIPDGAFVTNIGISRLSEDKELVMAKMSAMDAKAQYILSGVGDKMEIMPMFMHAERILDSRKDPFRISNISLEYLKSCDFNMISTIRRNNYMCLAQRIGRHSDLVVIHPVLDTTETPFMLPIYVKHGRKEFQQYMAGNNVFPTIIWSCPDVIYEKINSTTKEIYDTILCFHIDQRYDNSDMNRVGDIIDLYYTNYDGKQ